jgi:glucuronoarabinoxylan endo-1,4-beta-xylanase
MSLARRKLLDLGALAAIATAGACTIYPEELLFDDSRNDEAGGNTGLAGLGPGLGGHAITAGAPGFGGSSSDSSGGATSGGRGNSGGATGAGGEPTGAGGEPTGAGGEPTGAGGDVTGAGGEPTGAGGQATGTGGQVAGAAGQVTGAGGQVTGIGGQVAGAAGQPTGAGGEVTGAGGEVTGAGGEVTGAGGEVTGAGGEVAGSGGASGGSGGTGGAAAGGTAGSGTGGSGTGGALDPCADGTPDANDLVVDLDVTWQTMDGFGASDVWLGAISDADADLFFDQNLGIGLSILRVGITPTGGNHADWSNITKAAARGAIVWATPFSPPANCKSNNSLTDGGHLNQSCDESWSDTLAAFAEEVQTNAGVALYGISAQAAADTPLSSDSCVYTAAEMNRFVKVLGPKLHALSPRVNLLAAEPTAWGSLWGSGEDYGNAILGDASARAAVDILATHQYGSFAAVAPPSAVTHPIWQTETSGIPGSAEEGPSSDIGNGVVVARWIHNAIVVGEASAWHYWWLQSLNDDNEGLLLQDGSLTKRLYTMGNFSKFVRPGYQRVDVSGSMPSGVQVSAYRNPADDTVVIVAINSNTSSSSVSVFISGGAPCEVTPWVTSASNDLAAQSLVSISAARFTTTLAARSVTTFVGTP